MLEAAGMIELSWACDAEAGTIGALLVFSVGLGFHQERRARAPWRCCASWP
jgi:hypothetical protein